MKSLNLWGQDLSDVSLLTQMCAVEVLSLSVNNISSLKDFSSCHKLQELYLRKNEVSFLADHNAYRLQPLALYAFVQIPDVSEVSHLANLQDLRVLWLSDNPCAQNPDYRAKVRFKAESKRAAALLRPDLGDRHAGSANVATASQAGQR